MALTITNEDNMELMARYPDKHFDLAIVDPPYGIGASMPTTSTKKPFVTQKNGSKLRVVNDKHKSKNWDESPPSIEYFKELNRVSKNQIIWGVNYYDIYLGPGRIVWNKMNGDSDQYGCEIAYVSLNDRTDIVNYLWQGMFQGVYCGTDINRAIKQQGNKSLNEIRIHLTQKPVKLYKWLLDKYAKQGDKILDTHLGSGSIAIACHDYGFDLTACELDPEYYELAMKRIKNHTNQQTLFQP